MHQSLWQKEHLCHRLYARLSYASAWDKEVPETGPETKAGIVIE